MYKDVTGEDDSELWQETIRNIKPLKHNKPKTPLSNQQKTNRTKIKILETNQVLPTLPKQVDKLEILEIGDARKIDGSVAKKLREGKYPIDITLDLHGCTQDQAFVALKNTLSNAYNVGKRCLLVITGKGVQGKGILREQLPKWLAVKGIQEYILSIHYAKPGHGGSGAFYILLKNKGKPRNV